MKQRNNAKRVRLEQTRRPKKNPLKAAGIEKVDYKDINTLRQFISDRHKIRSRRVTGLTWAAVDDRHLFSLTLRFDDDPVSTHDG